MCHIFGPVGVELGATIHQKVVVQTRSCKSNIILQACCNSKCYPFFPDHCQQLLILDRNLSLHLMHLNNSPDTKPNADLDEVLNSMMERMADARWRCLNCAKTMANSTLMRRHCEIHLDCSHTCNVCGKKAKTRNALEIHTRRYHGNGVGINNIQY